MIKQITLVGGKYVNNEVEYGVKLKNTRKSKIVFDMANGYVSMHFDRGTNVVVIHSPDGHLQLISEKYKYGFPKGASRIITEIAKVMQLKSEYNLMLELIKNDGVYYIRPHLNKIVKGREVPSSLVRSHVWFDDYSLTFHSSKQ